MNEPADDFFVCCGESIASAIVDVQTDKSSYSWKNNSMDLVN